MQVLSWETRKPLQATLIAISQIFRLSALRIISTACLLPNTIEHMMFEGKPSKFRKRRRVQRKWEQPENVIFAQSLACSRQNTLKSGEIWQNPAVPSCAHLGCTLPSPIDKIPGKTWLHSDTKLSPKQFLENYFALLWNGITFLIRN